MSRRSKNDDEPEAVKVKVQVHGRH